MSDDETVGFVTIGPLHGPAVPADFVLAKARRMREAEADREQQDTQDWLAGLRAKAESEAAAWQALPCMGVLDYVGSCSEDFEHNCERRTHIMCPRRRVLEIAIEKRQGKAALRSRLAAAGVPERALRHVFDAQPLETEALKALQVALSPISQLPASPPTLVVLSGGVGCGKSCAAAWWLSQAEGAWVPASEFAKYGGDPAVPERLKAPRLVLDDLGMEYLDGKGFAQATLDGVINHRHERLLPTVITTNLGADEFKARYGPRVADRIRESGRWLVIAATSLRKRS
jgi:DNA replication protein DnaC